MMLCLVRMLDCKANLLAGPFSSSSGLIRESGSGSPILAVLALTTIR